MSSALDKMVPIFTGSNWQQWHTAMQAYLRAQGQWFVFSTPCPADEFDSWDEHNEKALGNITLHVSPSIQTAIANLATVKEVWEHLKETTAPPASAPPMPNSMLSHFAYFKDAGFEFPANVQAMIILCKLPPTMEVVAQILSQTSPSEIKSLKPDGIVKAATLSFEQKGASRGAGSKAPQANKLSAVKRKQVDPKFAQQQQQPQRQQQQQGGSNGSGSGNAPAQGQGGRYRRGGKKVRARRERAQNAEFATYIRYEDGPVPTVDPRALAHTTGATNYGPPAFDNTIKAFDLAHRLGVFMLTDTMCSSDVSGSRVPLSHRNTSLDVIATSPYVT
ncbi:hypothetical protein SCLCIDRAFT_26236 [Scleroderma citrinum Foug A]|uniref:DUF4219 domain-containing protein n=1 Tax=Scleroderma citrinum Foug A TaxID=1036808 RepID=A0A0C3DYA9_9AGAM|nr:hypothetical protein SCLCIDRAFT_26236 [Scleroderma citrinum Foug A]